MRIAACRRGLGRPARHRPRGGGDDDVGVGMPRRDLGVDVLAVVGTVAGEGPHWSIDPVEQGTDLGAVCGFRWEVASLPRPPPLGAVLLLQPLARAAEA